MCGCGSGGTVGALPLPLGLLIDPLSPRAFAGPGGMPLTPASWAGALESAARRLRTATLATHPRERIEAGCTRLIDG
jgi:hypothetical protein